jgi:uncharacterized membrane protein
MKNFFVQLKARPHLLSSAIIGALTVLALPASDQWINRLLIGWNVAVWLYLVQAFWVMSNRDHHHLRRAAIAQAEGAGAVLGAVTVAAVASIAAIVLELAGTKGAPSGPAWWPVLLALVTVVGSWLLLPTLFSLSYASLFYRDPAGQGLVFPSTEEKRPPDYWDFMYFSFTIAVACQTSDVTVSHSSMRRLVLLQSVLSFVFNTAILALTVNIAASMF